MDKVRQLCTECHCRRIVNSKFLEHELSKRKLTQFNVSQHYQDNGNVTLQQFEDVVRVDECSMMCLLIEETAAFIYSGALNLCTCLSLFLPHKFVCSEDAASLVTPTVMLIPVATDCVWSCGGIFGQ